MTKTDAFPPRKEVCTPNNKQDLPDTMETINEENDDYRPPRVPYETERFKWDYDDLGVLCRYSKEEESWTPIEPHCEDCGHRDDECDCDEEEELEDCETCGYTHHYEDKCPTGEQCCHYEKWREEELDEDEKWAKLKAWLDSPPEKGYTRAMVRIKEIMEEIEAKE